MVIFHCYVSLPEGNQIYYNDRTPSIMMLYSDGYFKKPDLLLKLFLYTWCFFEIFKATTPADLFPGLLLLESPRTAAMASEFWPFGGSCTMHPFFKRLPKLWAWFWTWVIMSIWKVFPCYPCLWPWISWKTEKGFILHHLEAEVWPQSIRRLGPPMKRKDDVAMVRIASWDTRFRFMVIQLLIFGNKKWCELRLRGKCLTHRLTSFLGKL